MRSSDYTLTHNPGSSSKATSTDFKASCNDSSCQSATISSPKASRTRRIGPYSRSFKSFSPTQIVGSTDRKASVLLLTTFSTSRDELCSFCIASDARLDRILTRSSSTFRRGANRKQNVRIWGLRRAALHRLWSSMKATMKLTDRTRFKWMTGLHTWVCRCAKQKKKKKKKKRVIKAHLEFESFRCEL